ncbi:MAG: hypothetical protein KKA10_03550 [Euryarchaeota archaeon]|nr:hypothetical protein [Euryarchaeota archaeon]MCG2736812.1 hypothetical protein [Candidatus Methanoperedenaceae archaeon]
MPLNSPGIRLSGNPGASNTITIKPRRGHQNKIHLMICLSFRFAQTSARGLREFDAAASHPRRTTG